MNNTIRSYLPGTYGLWANGFTRAKDSKTGCCNALLQRIKCVAGTVFCAPLVARWAYKQTPRFNAESTHNIGWKALDKILLSLSILAGIGFKIAQLALGILFPSIAFRTVKKPTDDSEGGSNEGLLLTDASGAVSEPGAEPMSDKEIHKAIADKLNEDAVPPDADPGAL